MIIYLAGPISGESYDQITEKIMDKKRRLMMMGYNVIHPMTGKNYLRNEIKFKAVGYDEFPASTNKAIVGRDRWMVSKCDIILADFFQSKRVSIGTVFEIAWAQEMGKLVIGVIDKDNIHQHAFVLETCDVIFETLKDAYIYLESIESGQI